jgi:hypothetical protein
MSDGNPVIIVQGEDSSLLNVRIPRVNRVDVRDVGKVTLFNNCTVNGVTTVDLNFVGDGSATIEYEVNGPIRRLKTHHVLLAIDSENGIIELRPWEEPPAPGIGVPPA